MDLKMEVYTPMLELVGLLEVHRSVIWEDKAFTAGSFSTDCLITPESKTLLVPDNVIWIEGATAGTIEYFHENSDQTGAYLTVKGPNLTGILQTRILWGRYDLTGTPPEIMCALVNDCCVNPTRGDAEARKIPGLVLLDPPAGGNIIRMQRTGGYLLTALEELGAAYGVAFGIRFNPAIPQMEFWTRWGQNRTVGQTVNEPVFYSRELDDVLSSEYSYNAQDYRNVALVAGEGEGDDRVMVTVEAQLPDAPTPPEPVKYIITLAVDPEGGGSATGGGDADAGRNVTVRAVPFDGYTFAGWRENGKIVSTDKIYTFTVKDNRNLTAVFEAITPIYTIAAAIDPPEGGTVTGAGRHQKGSTVTLTAVVNDGYTFTGWQENGQTVSTDNPYIFTAAGDRSFTATFEEKVSRLPDGYAELEYIQSTSGGKQYINTAVTPAAFQKITIDAEPLSPNTETISQYILYSEYPYLQSNKTRYGLVQLSWRDTGLNAAMVYGTTSTITTFVVDRNTTARKMNIVMDKTNRTVSVNGGVPADCGGTFSAGYATGDYIKLFGIGTSSANVGTYFRGKLYSCKIEDGAGKLLRDFVPCTNPSGVVGLFDLVSSTFYKSGGSTAFTAGPAI